MILILSFGFGFFVAIMFSTLVNRRIRGDAYQSGFRRGFETGMRQRVGKPSRKAAEGSSVTNN